MKLLRLLIFGIALLLLAALLKPWLTEVAWAVEHGTTSKDSLQFYTGASLVRSGHGAELYDLDAQRSLQDVLLPLQYRVDLPFSALLPYLSPPFVALVLAPLAGFSLPTFYILTGLVNLLLLAALIVALQKSVAGWPEVWRLGLGILTLGWLPVTWTLLWGQVSILLALSLTLGYLALRGQRDTLAGVALGLLWIKPQYAVLILPYLLLRSQRSRDWRAAGGFVAMTAILGVVSWATVGLNGLVTYARLLSGLETLGLEYGLYPASYHTLSGLLLRLLGVGGWPWFLLSGLLVAVVLWRLRSGFGPRSYALLVLASVLASPHTYGHDLTLLLPAIALGWDALRERRVLATIWLYLWFALGFGLYWWNVKQTLFQHGPLLTVPAMLLAVGLLLHPGLGVAPLTRPKASSELGSL